VRRNLLTLLCVGLTAAVTIARVGAAPIGFDRFGRLTVSFR
jgi:hypothetical protein